ncbi:MAG: cellulase family glycosylhydrolase [Chloroflexi bacterium]|nr:cellulase family glycosylhydrolase [Chloroflexota bacterium]
MVLLLGGSAVSSGPLDTAAIDLRHRWVALTGGHAPGDTWGAPPVVGMNVFLEQEVEPEKRQHSLDLLRAAGVTWIRQELPWEQIEPVARGQTIDPTFGGSTWTKFDDIVDRADASGLQVMLRLDTSPRWALPADAPDGLSPPVNDQDYWDFVAEVAERYRGRVAAYQIWNEPNLTSEWGHRSPDATAYAALLRGAADRIRAVDPSARIVMAALAPTLTENQDALNELMYLQQLYDAGIRGSFDVLAVQAYGLRGGPDDPRVDVSDVTFSRPELVRQVMERNGDAGTPVWATEVGWNVNPADFPVQQFGRVTPTLQARYTVRAFERAREQWPWMQVMCVWFWKRADYTNQNEDWFWFRVADPDFSLQPVYYALRDASVTAWR